MFWENFQNNFAIQLYFSILEQWNTGKIQPWKRKGETQLVFCTLNVFKSLGLNSLHFRTLAELRDIRSYFLLLRGDDWAFKDGKSCHKTGENHPCKDNNESFFRQPFTSSLNLNLKIRFSSRKQLWQKSALYTWQLRCRNKQVGNKVFDLYSLQYSMKPQWSSRLPKVNWERKSKKKIKLKKKIYNDKLQLCHSSGILACAWKWDLYLLILARNTHWWKRGMCKTVSAVVLWEWGRYSKRIMELLLLSWACVCYFHLETQFGQPHMGFLKMYC